VLTILAENLLWWHWIAFGIILITLEMFTGTFMLLGLGLAAMIVGEIDNFFDITLTMQLALWILLSLVSLGVWFRYLKDHRVETSGQSNDAINAKGVVTQTIPANDRGRVRFDTPILGNTLWYATAKESIEVGSRVKIIQIKGQLIEVERL
jgi:membrane protein implicated in regulation of membrane protease activity